MTLPTVTELTAGNTVFQVIDVEDDGTDDASFEPTPSADNPPPLAIFREQAYSASDAADHIPTLNLSRDKLGEFVETQAAEIESARKQVARLQQRVVEYGPLDDPATYERLRKQDEALFDELTTAERKLDNRLGSIRLNLAAVRNETAASPLVLGPRLAEMAAARLPLDKEQVERAPFRELAGLMRLAISNDDKIAQFNYAMLVPDRLKQSPTTRNTDGTVRRDLGDDPQVRNEITGMLAMMRSNLKDNSFDELRRKVNTIEANASKVKNDVKARRRALDTQRAGYVRRTFS